MKRKIQASSFSTVDLQNTNFKYKGSPFARANQKPEYHGRRDRGASSGDRQKRLCLQCYLWQEYSWTREATGYA